MSRIRDPARDKAKQMYLESKGKITNREIANTLGIDEKKIATWKIRDNWKCSTTKNNNVVQQNKKCSTTNKKKLIKEAKTIVVQGGTIKDASNQTGLNESTIKNYSSKEKWIEQQERFLQNVYGRLQEEEGEKHIQRRKEAIDYLNYIQKKTMSKLSSGNLDKKEAEIMRLATSIVKSTIESQEKLLGIKELKIEFNKDDINKYTENKTVDILDKLEKMVDE